MAKKVSDERLLELLLVHGGVKGAAAACGLSQNAIYRRLQNDEFRQRYDSLQSVLLASAASNMADALSDAVAALRYVVADPYASAGARISAADSLLRHALRYVETANILQRLERLEQDQQRDAG